MDYQVAAKLIMVLLVIFSVCWALVRPDPKFDEYRALVERDRQKKEPRHD